MNGGHIFNKGLNFRLAPKDYLRICLCLSHLINLKEQMEIGGYR